MVERTRQRAAASAGWNVIYMARDVFAEGLSGESGSQNACLWFNILHCEEPVRFLSEAARMVLPGGEVLVIHWRYDLATPRGPSMEIRPKPEQIVQWGSQTGRLELDGQVLDLPPWHYGLRLRRKKIEGTQMESASLYAFAEKKRKPVICFAHITNQMAAVEGDFEKGESSGSVESLRLIGAVAEHWSENQLVGSRPKKNEIDAIS
jgi:hypothetical protein